MARPNKEFSKEEFEKLCGLQCTEEEICDWFETTDKTLTRWCRRTYRMSFSEVHKKKSVKGKMSLRRSQFELAKKSAAMAIFLGKNYLGQSDTVKVENRAEGLLADLIDGLKEPEPENDIYTETESHDAALAAEQTPTNQSS